MTFLQSSPKKFAASLATLTLLTAGAAPATADAFLLYGPSLAVWLQEQNGPVPTASTVHAHQAAGGRGDGAPFLIDESHMLVDAGHTVTIVDAAEWASMTTEEFAAFDAIVIGDAGCDFDGGELLDPLATTKFTWSPAVTGHVFAHTFDPVYHANQNVPGDVPTSTEQLQAMTDLVVRGAEYAASAPGRTGLFYGNGCRFFGGGGGVPVAIEGEETFSRIEFLSLLVSMDATVGDHHGDVVEIADADHPVMVSFTDEGLSGWSNSYHAHFETFAGLGLLAIDPTDFRAPTASIEGLDDLDAIIVATDAPIGDAIVFTDGFESGDTGAWSSVSACAVDSLGGC